MNLRLSNEVITTPHTETHAYYIPHVDVTNTRIEKYVAADSILTNNDTPVVVQDKLMISAIDRKKDCISFGNSYSLSYFANDSAKYSSDEKIHAQLMRKAEPIDHEIDCTKEQRKNHNRQYAGTANDDARNETTSTRTLKNVNHIYEEVRATKEPRSSTAMKALINTLFFPRHKICKECMETYYHSPVYTDRLIYARKSLLAVEVILCHRDDVSCFQYCDRQGKFSPILCSQYNADRDQNCMLIYNYVKTNVAGIFYSHWLPRDVFDLESILKPNIYVISRTCNVVMNTQLYHRYINNYHVRVSRAGCTPMTFRHDHGIIVDCTKRISYNDNLLDSLNYRRHQLKDDDNDEHRQDRSSLLLEPLLLMPELASPRQNRKNKKPVLRSERTKVIRISIAYALLFFVFTSITFYVVYFT